MSDDTIEWERLRASPEFELWCTQVVSEMRTLDRVRNIEPGETHARFLFRCRGDEPLMCFQMGDSVAAYVRSLTEIGRICGESSLGYPCNRDGDTGYLDPEDLL